jgi:hypothetical protein
MAKQEIEAFETGGFSVRLIKTTPAERGERSRWHVELDGEVRGVLFFPTGTWGHWTIHPLTGKPKSINDLIRAFNSGSPKEKREAAVREMVKAIAKGKKYQTLSEIAAEKTANEATAKRQQDEYTASRQAYIERSAETILGMEAILERLRGQMSNHEIAMFEDSFKLMHSGAPGGTREEMERLKRKSEED